ncbi:hypothetical protein [Prosthecobacter sp.]|uniref:hypothetical protein n=1 Tax=Prosthecobacter sp. TaxID=1965333 RepID=UPI0024871A22|nr:hypothetical protein [Prosthecobacter sp.]MDI1314914.1 hypothetical protein [Prosthecobacter sp.]
MNRSYKKRRRGVAERSPRAKSNPRRAQSLALTGVILVLLALVLKGIGLVMLSHGAATLDLGKMNDQKDLAGALAPFLSALASAGTILSAGDWLQVIGAMGVTYAFQWGEYRGRWFFWAMLSLALVLVWLPVSGTVFGVWWFWCLAWARHEFFSKQVISTSP